MGVESSIEWPQLVVIRPEVLQAKGIEVINIFIGDLLLQNVVS